MNKIKGQLRYSIHDFSESFLNSRMWVILALQLFFLSIFLGPVKRFTIYADYPISIWILPFLMTSLYFKLFYILGVIYVYTKVPFFQYSQMYKVIRTGRIKWGISKIIGILVCGFFLMIAEFILSIIPLIGNISFEEGWGKVIYSLSMTDAIDQFEMRFVLPYELIGNYKPLEAMGILVIVGGLIATAIGLLMFTVSLYFSRLSASIIAMLFAVMPVVQENLSALCKWFVFVSPVSWMDFTNIARKEGSDVPTLNYILVVLISAIILLSGLILYKIRKIDLNWNKED